MAGVSFIGSEFSALRFTGAALEVTSGGTFRSANSRGSMYLIDSVPQFTATWAAAVAEGWIHAVATSSWDNDSSDNILIVYTGAVVPLFRLMTSAVATVQAQYWNGSAWVNTAAVFAINGALQELVIHLIAGASGSFEVYQNGTLLRSGSVVFVGTDMQYANFYCPDDNQFAVWWSEIMLSDNSYSLVSSVCETEAPTANGTDTTGTGSYTDVDEIPLSDVDAITFAAAGLRNSFTSPARTSTLANVIGVSVAARMKRDTTGPQKAKFYLKIGGTRYYSGDLTLGLAYDAYQYTWVTNPSTGVAWTATDANSSALEWGIESVT